MVNVLGSIGIICSGVFHILLSVVSLIAEDTIYEVYPQVYSKEGVIMYFITGNISVPDFSWVFHMIYFPY